MRQQICLSNSDHHSPLPPTQAFLGELLIFHPSPQTPAHPRTKFLSDCFICIVSDQPTVVK